MFRVIHIFQSVFYGLEYAYVHQAVSAFITLQNANHSPPFPIFPSSRLLLKTPSLPLSLNHYPSYIFHAVYLYYFPSYGRFFFSRTKTQEELTWLGRRLNDAPTVVPDNDRLFDSDDEPSEILPQAYEV